MTFFFKQKAWLWPSLLFLLVAPFTPALDLKLAHFFYNENRHFATDPFFIFMFDYGVIPAQLTFITASVFFLLSYPFSKLKKFRSSALTLVVTFILGAGVITHALFKDHWGRPRPKQIEEFGGIQAFRPFYQPNFFNQPEPSKSFPCGHCTMGFYFFSLAILGHRLQNQWLLWSSIFLSVTLGGLLSYTRIAQGGHFFSDTLFSALVMWLTAYICDKCFFLGFEKKRAFS